MNGPMGYHITFGTYGTRLHGDARGTVDSRRNAPGDPIIGRNEDWERLEASFLQFPPVRLTGNDRRHIECNLPAICERGGWQFIIGAAQVDHVQVMLSTSSDGKAVRKWLKRWLGESLSHARPLASGARWWSKGGSVKWIWDQSYFNNVFAYVKQQRLSES